MSQHVFADDSAAELAAWWRLVELCHPLHETCGALTFQPSGIEALDGDWDAWIDGIHVPVLVPALGRLLPAACAQDLRGLLEADAQLCAALPSDAVHSSLAAGRRSLAECIPPRGAKLLENLRACAVRDESIGSIATVFAVRGHVFHIPGVQLSGALLLAECVAGADSVGMALPAARAAGLVRRAIDAMRCGASLELAAV